MFFLPVIFAFALIGIVYSICHFGAESFLQKKYPYVARWLPIPIWAVVIGISIGNFATEISDADQWNNMFPGVRGLTVYIRDLAISAVILITGSLQYGRIQKTAKMIKRLLIPTTVGAVGVGLGALLSFWIIWIFSSSDGPYRLDWSLLRSGVTANMNGWIGDSTTLMPTLALVTDLVSENPSDLHPAPPVLALDVVFGITWLLLATFVARRSASQNIKGAVISSGITQSKTHYVNSSDLSIGSMVLILCIGGAGATLMYILSQLTGTTSAFLKPTLVIVWYMSVGLVGYKLGALRMRLGNNRLVRRLLLMVIITFSIAGGLSIDFTGFNQHLPTLWALFLCALGAFSLHIIFLLPFARKYGWGILAITSTCAIGGLVTAPIVAAEYSDELIDPSYIAALWCNIVSIPICVLIWHAFPFVT